MPEYLSPGVYVEEIDAGPVPIEGVATSTTGAVGVTERGPATGKPVLVTGFSEFTRLFGGFLDDPDQSVVDKWSANTNAEGGTWWQFPLAVKAFFDNGGQRLYVKRVVSSTAVAASGTTGKGLVSEIVKDSPNGATLKLRHLIGIGTSVTNNGAVVADLTIFRDGQKIGTSKVTAYDPDTGEVTLQTPPNQTLKAGRDYVEIFPRSKWDAAAGKIPDAEASLVISARSPGQWGNEMKARVRPIVTATLRLLPAPGGTPLATTVKSASYPPAVITLGVPPADAAKLQQGDHLKIGGDIYVIKTPPTTQPFTIEYLGNKPPFDPKIVAGDPIATDTVLNPVTTTAASYTYAAPKWTVTVADATGLAPTDRILVEGVEYAITTITGPDLVDLQPINAAKPIGTLFAAGTRVQRLQSAGKNVIQIRVNAASQLYQGALVEFDNGQAKEITTVDTISGPVVQVSTSLANQYYETSKVRLIEAEIAAQYEGASEVFRSPLTTKGQELAAEINANSKLIQVRVVDANFSDSDLALFPTTPAGMPAGFDNAWITLSNGDDSLNGLSPDDFVGTDGGSGHRTGIAALEDIEDIAICMVPGMWSQSVQSALIAHCEALRYRFAILDPADGLSIEGIQTVRAALDTKYAALYYPWVRVRDPQKKQTVNLAPSGHLAGIYARVDTDRGVHKAPANEVLKVVDLTQGIAQDVNKREQDVLNPENINVLRFFPDRGNRVWGARTLSSDTAWKYINVRRLFIYLEHSLDKGTQWVVFEPNDEPLWARVRQSITNFLTTTWHTGALQGVRPEEAFFVKCDRTTMSQDDLDNGRLIILVGVAPVKPAEFVIIRIQQKTLDQKAP
jgi:hypothetical protein